MKIKTAEMKYSDVLSLPAKRRSKPKKPNILFRTLVRIVSQPDIKAVNFKYTAKGMEKLSKNEPCLILMNHSSFIDLKIASAILYPRPYNIVCTSDGFVGKEWLMRNLGCIPTNKFVNDTRLVRDMLYAVKNLKSSVLMYPEASYSFDGTATPIADSLGKCIKILSVPVVMIKTNGAFARDPLYNSLQLRKTDVSADVEYILSPEEILDKSIDEINKIIRKNFEFDNFRWQQKNKIKIDEPFRADGLNRVLYKCPHCLSEGQMIGKGITVECKNCGEKYELTEYGYLKSLSGTGKFNHIPNWYAWQRECVKKELLENTYHLKVPVDIYMMVNTKCVYRIGSGTLEHSLNGFHLTGCDGQLDYSQKPISSYSLYSDYFWYEIGDTICIGDSKKLFYCFPQSGDVVAKTRLATEELYKIVKNRMAYTENK